MSDWRAKQWAVWAPEIGCFDGYYPSRYGAEAVLPTWETRMPDIRFEVVTGDKAPDRQHNFLSDYYWKIYEPNQRSGKPPRGIVLPLRKRATA